MQIRKTYKEVNPELLYDEVKDFIFGSYEIKPH